MRWDNTNLMNKMKKCRIRSGTGTSAAQNFRSLPFGRNSANQSGNRNMMSTGTVDINARKIGHMN